MKKIPSFTIDHIRLLRGIYVSRKDEVNGEVITTFDIRMKEPNREPALGQGALHTIEHLAATYLRNEPQWQDKIIYWCLRNAALGRRWEGFTWRMSRICSSRIRHSPPETTWEIMVAMATPATSQWKPATNHTSSTMFSRQAMMRKITGMTESPRPRSTPERIL